MSIKLKNTLFAMLLIALAISSYTYFLWDTMNSKPDEATVSFESKHRTAIGGAIDPFKPAK